jgi:uncharacterized protein DUF6438
MKSVLSIFGCVVAMVFARNSISAEQSSVFFDNKDAAIRYENYNSCRECQGYEVVIFTDGRVLYTGKAHVNVMGQKWYRVDPQDVALLRNLLSTQGFFELQDSYVAKALADGNIAEISFRQEGKQKTIRFHYTANKRRPKPLVDFASEIDETARIYPLRCPADGFARKLC